MWFKLSVGIFTWRWLNRHLPVCSIANQFVNRLRRKWERERKRASQRTSERDLKRKLVIHHTRTHADSATAKQQRTIYLLLSLSLSAVLFIYLFSFRSMRTHSQPSNEATLNGKSTGLACNNLCITINWLASLIWLFRILLFIFNWPPLRVFLFALRSFNRSLIHSFVILYR